ncbi:MAG: pitrilysin family protein, partial [Syntrophales bacterium]|nr:pitrilysin family protein [Syntrophales bacterium]
MEGSEGKGGLANLTTEGILLGTSQYSFDEINEKTDSMGSEIDVSCGRDFAVLSMKSLKKNLEPTLDIFIDVLINPIFPESEIERKKAIILGQIQSRKDNPKEVAENHFREKLFLTFPFGHPLEGTEESIPKLDRIAVLRFHQSFWRPNNNAVIAIVGDITVNEIKEHIIPMIGNWASGKIDESSVPSKFAEGPLTVTEHMPISQANIVMGHRGIERGNPDYYSVLAMNHILGGGGLGSRLMRKIRIEKGLAYSVSSNFDAGKRSGIFQVSVQTHTAAANRAVSTIINEMESMQKYPVSNEELATAKKYLVGSFPLKLTTQSGVASLVAQMEYFNLG